MIINSIPLKHYKGKLPEWVNTEDITRIDVMSDGTAWAISKSMRVTQPKPVAIRLEVIVNG